MSSNDPRIPSERLTPLHVRDVLLPAIEHLRTTLGDVPGSIEQQKIVDVFDHSDFARTLPAFLHPQSRADLIASAVFRFAQALTAHPRDVYVTWEEHLKAVSGFPQTSPVRRFWDLLVAYNVLLDTEEDAVFTLVSRDGKLEAVGDSPDRRFMMSQLRRIITALQHSNLSTFENGELVDVLQDIAKMLQSNVPGFRALGEKLIDMVEVTDDLDLRMPPNFSALRDAAVEMVLRGLDAESGPTLNLNEAEWQTLVQKWKSGEIGISVSTSVETQGEPPAAPVTRAEPPPPPVQTTEEQQPPLQNETPPPTVQTGQEEQPSPPLQVATPAITAVRDAPAPAIEELSEAEIQNLFADKPQYFPFNMTAEELKPGYRFVRPHPSANLLNFVVRYNGKEYRVPRYGVIKSNTEKGEVYFRIDYEQTVTVPEDGICFFACQTHRMSGDYDYLLRYQLFLHFRKAGINFENVYPGGGFGPSTPESDPYLLTHVRDSRLFNLFGEPFNYTFIINGNRRELEVYEPLLDRFNRDTLVIKPPEYGENAISQYLNIVQSYHKHDLFKLGDTMWAYGTPNLSDLLIIALEGDIYHPVEQYMKKYKLLSGKDSRIPPSHQQGLYELFGPLFVVINSSKRDSQSIPQPRDNHRAYLLPDTSSKKIFLHILTKLVKMEAISANVAAEIRSKVYTYDEFVAAVRNNPNDPAYDPDLVRKKAEAEAKKGSNRSGGASGTPPAAPAGTPGAPAPYTPPDGSAASAASASVEEITAANDYDYTMDADEDTGEIYGGEIGGDVDVDSTADDAWALGAAVYTETAPPVTAF